MSLEGANMCPHLLHLSKSGGNLVSFNPSVLQPSPAGLPSSRTTLLPQSKSLQNYNVQADDVILEMLKRKLKIILILKGINHK